MQNDSSCNELIYKVAKAFPSTLYLSHEDCLEIRKEIFYSNDKDILNLLGPVLLDLILHHTRSSCEPTSAASVVRFLASGNPTALGTIPGKQLITAQIEDFAIAQQSTSEVSFRIFNKEQVAAIIEWLLAALSWNEAHLPQDEIKAALEYWNEAQNVKGGGS